jgi:hypothetical protein
MELDPSLVFSALVTPPGRSGIFLWLEGSVQAIAQTGDPAPGGDTFNFPNLGSLYAPSRAFLATPTK